MLFKTLYMDVLLVCLLVQPMYPEWTGNASHYFLLRMNGKDRFYVFPVHSICIKIPLK